MRAGHTIREVREVLPLRSLRSTGIHIYTSINSSSRFLSVLVAHRMIDRPGSIEPLPAPLLSPRSASAAGNKITITTLNYVSAEPYILYLIEASRPERASGAERERVVSNLLQSSAVNLRVA